MSNRFSWLRLACVIGILAIAIQACGATDASIATPTATSGTVPEVTPPPLASPHVVQAAALPSVTASASQTPTSAPVLVTATKGNVFIRRGPDLAFNPLSLLRDGQSAQALARDVLAEWVQIRFPGQPEKTGWISVQTHYIRVSGNVMSLPEIEPTDWPALASVRNCTYHQMQIDPGAIVLPSVDDFPDNDVQLNPGMYVIRDTDAVVVCPAKVSGHAKRCDPYPVVLTVDVSEGSVIDVHVDGNGEKRKCPLP